MNPDTRTALTALLSTAHLTLPADPTQETLNAALRTATERWGLGLHHLHHTAQINADGTVTLTAGTHHPIGLATDPPAALARAYHALTAPDERGLSAWHPTGDGYVTPIRNPAQLRVLIEDARDFETHWTPRKDTFYRVWRRTTEQGEHLTTEVMRPTRPEDALQEGAWDAIRSIKDRVMQRDLMTRSEQGGMLKAFLSARYAGAEADLDRLHARHFAVQAFTVHLTGADARQDEAVRAALRTAVTELDQTQANAAQHIAALLKGDLRSS